MSRKRVSGMFENIGTFSAIFWVLAVVLLLLILFEKPLVALEEKRCEARKKRIKELEEENSIYRYIIGVMAEKILALDNKLKAQESINEVNLEDLRRERMKNREVKE